MKREILNAFFLAAFVFLNLSCGGGLEPSEAETGITGFSGKITFIGDWPEGIKRTHLVVFKDTIIDENDFFPPNLSIIIDSVAYGTSVFTYNSEDNNFIEGSAVEAGTYSYVVVAQSKTETLSLFRSDWTVAGVYYAGSDSTNPGVLKIEKGKMTKNINIICDFNNPPPQPPGGN